MSFSFRQTYEQGLVNLLLSLKTAPHNPVHKLDLYEWANMRRRSSPCWYFAGITVTPSSLSIIPSVLLTQDSDAYGGSYGNRNVYQFASRFVFLWQRTWPAITYIYIYVYFSFWYFLNAYLRSTTVWTPHVNFSDKEVNAPGERFPAP